MKLLKMIEFRSQHEVMQQEYKQVLKLYEKEPPTIWILMIMAKKALKLNWKHWDDQ